MRKTLVRAHRLSKLVQTANESLARIDGSIGSPGPLGTLDFESTTLLRIGVNLPQRSASRAEHGSALDGQRMHASFVAYDLCPKVLAGRAGHPLLLVVRRARHIPSHEDTS